MSVSGRPAFFEGGGLAPATAGDQVVTTLFRALAVLRVLVMAYAVTKNLDRMDRFDHPWAGWVVIGIIVVWTAVMTWVYDDPRRRVFTVYLADLLVAVGLVLSTPYIQSQRQLDAHAAHMPTFWVMAAVLAWAVGRGWVEGLVAAAVVSAADVAVKVSVNATTFGNIFLLLLGAGMIGYTASMLRTAVELRAAADRAAAAAAERARIARVIHDGVLQVLALVQRRGLEAGGEMADLARLAGEQEVALRSFVQSSPAAPGESDLGSSDLDLGELLSRLASASVTVSLPGGPVLLPVGAADEIFAVVSSCLSNVRHHVGRDAPAWVLLEDLGDRWSVSVRDEGPGIPAGRLAEAASEGRLGVAQSIIGRMRDLGGTATLHTAEGQGTEWEIVLPKGAS